MIKERNIGLAILFSILSCGLYSLYWFIAITDEANELSGKPGTSGGISLLLLFVTGGIYIFIWAYQMGKTMYTAQQRAGVAATDNSVLYLILTLFGLGIIPYCIIQSDINALVR